MAPPQSPSSAPSSAFLRALAQGLASGSAGPSTSSTTAMPMPTPAAAAAAAAANLHPSVISALAQAQAALASMDTLYARQLESIREAAGRARGKLMSVRERAGGFPGGFPGGAPLGGSPGPLPGGAQGYQPSKLSTGQTGRAPGALSFQDALAHVRREHSVRL